MAYQGFSPVDWARPIHTTLADHIREVEPAMLRAYKFGALLQENGQVSYNNDGRGLIWPVQYRLHDVVGNTGYTPRNFAPTNLWLTANLPYRGYQATDSISKRELKENRGESAIVRVFDGFSSRIEQSLKQKLGPQYYIDGTLAANAEFWHGLESMFGINGTLNIGTGAQRAANAADMVGYPSQTYAGLNTELGYYGGENESGAVWPNGVADPEFDFWSPLVWNATSSAFAASTHTFAGQGDEVMRYAIVHQSRNTTESGQTTNIWLSRNWYIQFCQLQSVKEQIVVGAGAQTPLRALGFRDVISFHGVEVSHEAAIPANTGYGMNIKDVELRCLDDAMFDVDEPEYDIDTQQFKCAVGTLSNLKFNSPRNFFKIANLAA